MIRGWQGNVRLSEVEHQRPTCTIRHGLCPRRGQGAEAPRIDGQAGEARCFFGGKARIIDFVLSNTLNSGIRRIAVATQYNAHSLIRHMQRGWNFFRTERNESFDILPASQRLGHDKWYAGTADAVFQNADIIESYEPKFIILLAGDHIYKMDYEQMLQQHVEQQADVTVGCIEVPIDEAKSFGVMQIGEKDQIIDFLEKPDVPPSMPGMPDVAMCSMGIYVFDTRFLVEQLRRDAADPDSTHDFGNDIIPRIVRQGKAIAHHFSRSCVRSSHETKAYWRDIGTIDAYWAANIDLTDVEPGLDLYDHDWPIWTNSEITAPAKFVHDEESRRGSAVSSLVSGGCIVSGSSLKRSLLFSNVRTHSYSVIENSVILPNVTIGRSARLNNCIVDAGVHIPEGLVVGEDPVLDAKRFRRSEKGICVISESMINRLVQ